MHHYFVLKSKKEQIPIKIQTTGREINTDIMWAYVEFTPYQYEYYEEHPNAPLWELWNCENAQEEHERTIEEARNDKIIEIINYDTSDNVNGFFLGEHLVWLDKESRSCLMNTLNSADIIGREQINIWFSGMYVPLTISTARQMLAALEIYATDCYNVTETHKVQVSQMEDISEIEEFDITADYPQRLVFNIN